MQEPASALGQKRTHAVQQSGLSFDGLIGAREYRQWQGESECFCGLEISRQFELDRLFNWKISGARTVKDLIDVGGGAAIQVRVACTEAHEAA